MAIPSAYTQNFETKVMNASPSELTLMLYDGIIRFCNIALVGLEQNNMEKTHINIIKAQNIITYLRTTLDMQYEVANEFEKMYVYLERRLVEANVEKSTEILEEVCMLTRKIRDNWKEVTRINKEQGVIC